MRVARSRTTCPALQGVTAGDILPRAAVPSARCASLCPSPLFSPPVAQTPPPRLAPTLPRTSRPTAGRRPAPRTRRRMRRPTPRSRRRWTPSQLPMRLLTHPHSPTPLPRRRMPSQSPTRRAMSRSTATAALTRVRPGVRTTAHALCASLRLAALCGAAPRASAGPQSIAPPASSRSGRNHTNQTRHHQLERRAVSDDGYDRVRGRLNLDP